MKIRSGFVSNSSSSSFTCCICGDTDGGYDVSLKDAKMLECEEGHIFCESHAEMDDYDEIEFFKENVPEKDLKIMGITKIELTKLSHQEIKEEYQEYVSDFMEYFPNSLCPICNFEYIPDDIIFRYLLVECKLDKDNLRKEMVKRFGDYGGFLEWVEAEKKPREETRC